MKCAAWQEQKSFFPVQITKYFYLCFTSFGSQKKNETWWKVEAWESIWVATKSVSFPGHITILTTFWSEDWKRQRTSSCALSCSFQVEERAQYAFVYVSEPDPFLIFAQHINDFWNPLSADIPEVSCLVWIKMYLTPPCAIKYSVLSKECGTMK